MSTHSITERPPDQSDSWQDVVGFSGYQVNADGRVRSCRPRNGRGHLLAEYRPLRCNRTRQGYWRVVLCAGGGRQRTVPVHHLVLEVFVSPCPDGMEGCHNDGDKDNNRLANLRWDTPKGNAADRNRHGTQVLGRSYRSKLSFGAVLEIRRLRRQGVKAKDLAARFGVAASSIWAACRRTWQWVDEAGATFQEFVPAKAAAARLLQRRSRRSLAAEAGIDTAFLLQLEGGRKRPRWETVCKIASALAVTPESLCDERPVTRPAGGSVGSKF